MHTDFGPHAQTRAAEEVCQQVPPGFAESVSLVYFPQLGYLINVPFSDETLIEGRCEEVGWDFQVGSRLQQWFGRQSAASAHSICRSSIQKAMHTSKVTNAVT